MATEGKEGSMRGFFIAMTISLLIALLWNSLSFIKGTAHAILNPTAGALLNWNLDIGMSFLVLFLAFVMTLAQKYGTDQKTLREIRAEQKKLNEESKKLRHDPQKMMELNKKIIPMSMQMFKLSMRPIVYTAIPLILFFRWFDDFFFILGDPKVLGFFSWFWFYLLGSLIFSSILRKVMKVA